MKTILITGQTQLITTKILEQISGRFSVVLASEDKGREEDEARVYHLQPGTTSFEQIFWAYDFSAVWYFTPCCDGKSDTAQLDELRAVYDLCRENSVRKLLVVSSALLSEQEMNKEEELLFSWDIPELMVAMVRVPWVLVDGNEGNSLGRLFFALSRRGRKIPFPDTEDDSFEFLPLSDLIGLLGRMTLSSRDNGSYSLPGEYVITRDQLEKELTHIRSGCTLSEDGRVLNISKPRYIDILSEKYGYLVRDKKQLDLAGLFHEYNDRQERRSLGAWLGRIRRRIPQGLVQLLDIVVLFLLAEYISKFTTDFVFFKEIDVRLIYIFLIATFHGLRAGVVASLAECVVLFFQYQRLGVYGLQLFYNVENWIPFVLCIVAGAVTGYFSDLREKEKELVSRENALLREKYLFLNDMYNVSSEIRDGYRRQILSFDHSYGKIYAAIERMTCVSREEVLGQAQEVLTSYLDNPSVAIYRKEEGGDRMELHPCSKGATSAGRRFPSGEGRKEMLAVIQGGGVYKNIPLTAGVPMYAVSLTPSGDHLAVIWDALPEQMNDYYANQFEILCRLCGRALEQTESQNDTEV